LVDHPVRFGGRERKTASNGGLSISGEITLKTNVYIDGFNLYRGRLKGTPYRWLDLGALCTALFPHLTIKRIRYFTAAVMAFSHDPQAPVRQDIYLRALGTIPNLTVHKEGWFASYPALLPQFPLAHPRGLSQSPNRVQILKNEEKRTDVDLATYLLMDCFSGDFDAAVVISNDADLVLPIEMVKTKFGKQIGVINPHPKGKMSGHLARAASYHKRSINNSVLARCQFPDPVLDAGGRQIAKPPSW
jgi:hypothetical protein